MRTYLLILLSLASFSSPLAASSPEEAVKAKAMRLYKEVLTENLKLKGQVAVLAQEVEDFDKKNLALIFDLASTGKDLELAEGKANATEELRVKAAQSNLELAETVKQLKKQLKQKKTKENQRKVAQSASQNKALLEKIEKLKRQMSGAKKVAEKKNADIERLKKQLSGKDKKISDLEVDASSLEEQLKTTTAQLKEFRKKVGALSTENDQLAKQNSSLEQELRANRSQAVEITQLRDDNERLQARVAELAAHLHAESTAHRNAQASLECHLAQVKHANATFVQVNGALAQDAKMKGRAYIQAATEASVNEDARQDLAHQLFLANREIQRLKKENDALSQAAKTE